MQFALFSVVDVVARIPSRRRYLYTGVAITDGKLFFRSVTLSAARDRESSSGSFPSVPDGNVRRLALCGPVRAVARCSYRCFRSHFTRLLFALVYPSCMSYPTQGRSRAPFFILRGKYYIPLLPSSFNSLSFCVRVPETTTVIIIVALGSALVSPL